MPDCILHFGLPKTGSSAIQMALRTGLVDPRFRYGSFQRPPDDGGNHGRSLAVMFSDRAASYYLNVRDRLDDAALAMLRRGLLARLDAEIGRLHGATLVLHSESVNFLSSAELAKLRDHFRARDVHIRPVGYVRPFREAWESLFVQMVKSGFPKPSMESLSGSGHAAWYRRFVADLDAQFGRDRVGLWLYDRRSFPGGCVVSDFCGRLGIEAPPAGHPAVNPGICLDAVRLLYAHRTHGAGGIDHRTNAAVVDAVGELEGPRFRFHPSVVARAMEQAAGPLGWLEDRVGAPLRGVGSDDGPSIRVEEDLLRFSPESLDWLARRSRTRASSLVGGDPKAVAEAVDRLATIESTRRHGWRERLRARAARFLAPFTRRSS